MRDLLGHFDSQPGRDLLSQSVPTLVLDVEPGGRDPVGLLVAAEDIVNAVDVVPVRVDKVVTNVDIVVVTCSLESLEFPLSTSPSDEPPPPGISTTHKIMTNINKSIKITTRMIIFLCLLSFTEYMMLKYLYQNYGRCRVC